MHRHADGVGSPCAAMRIVLGAMCCLHVHAVWGIITLTSVRHMLLQHLGLGLVEVIGVLKPSAHPIGPSQTIIVTTVPLPPTASE